MEKIVAVSMTAYDGYPLETALEQVAKLGCRYVELTAISGIIEHIREEDFNEEYFQKLGQIMAKHNLSSVAFSGHVDLTEEGIIPVFKKRMDFARKIGAEIINTNAGPGERIEKFYENIIPIAEHAEKIGITVGLESHGDIINSGKESGEVIERIGSDKVRINYDFANTLTFSHGEIKPEDDFEYILDYTDHLHIKDVLLSEGKWEFTKVGEGMIDYERIFTTLKDNNLNIPMSLEFPLRLTGKKGESLRKSLPRPEIGKINEIVKDSMEFVEKLIQK